MENLKDETSTKWNLEDILSDIRTQSLSLSEDVRKSEALYNFFAEGDLEDIKKFISCGFNLNRFIKNCHRPLDIAILNHNTKLVKFLIDYGVEINHGSNYEPVLHLAAGAGNLDIVKILIKNGANPNVYDHKSSYPIHWAAEKGHAEIVEFLIKIQDPRIINDEDYFNVTPLLHAIKGGFIPVADVLIKNGARLTPDTWTASSPLLNAVKCNNQEMVNFLLKSGVDIEKENEEYWYGAGLHHVFKNLKINGTFVR